MIRLPDLGGFVAEHEQHRVNHVGLPAPVGSDDAGETLVERSEDLLASVGLEPLVLDVGDDQPGARVVHGERWGRWRWDVDVVYPDSSLRNVVLLGVHQLLLVGGSHNLVNIYKTTVFL